VAKELDLELTGGVAIRRPQDVRKGDGEPFKVYTPFSRAWLALPALSRDDLAPTPRKLPSVSSKLGSRELPEPDVDLGAIEAGEDAALRRLKAFTDDRIAGYANGRNLLGEAGTSVLSPYLRFGMISPRECAVAAIEARSMAKTAEDRRGAGSWLNELIWRDFYLSVLYHWPEVVEREFDPQLRGIPWRKVSSEVEAWQEGKTGYPIVDAAMRQLAETGWMHNRARMVVASFLVKHLLADWRIGEQWFMDQLLDGDPAANNGGWQWTAGVGTDAAPYFRVFNPVLQAKRFDPDGAYVRRWVPELKDAPQKQIHEPWKLPDAQRQKLDYPAPIVDLAEGRQRALDAYSAAKDRNGK
jgi:deoxyribodipyrimidine photo-lyase